MSIREGADCLPLARNSKSKLKNRATPHFYGNFSLSEKMAQNPPDWFRGAEIIFGLVSVLISMVIILNPGYGNGTLVLLLSLGLFFNAVRMISTGGVGHLSRSFRGIGLIGGALVVTIVALGFFSPGLGISTVISLLASGLIVQGAARIANVAHAGHPRWLRVSALTVGSLTVVLASVTLLEPNLALVSLVALLTIVLLINGFESIISGVRPSSRKQLTLLKLIVFAIFYGFVNINWIDLFATSAPGYHIWLILTYIAPFGVLLVFQGLKDWQLALSLGLLVSLLNDVGYYFTGDLLFGFHVPLVPWLAGQLGFLGNTVLFVFQGGFFTFPVTSTLMGLSIYSRIAVVTAVLFHWWRYPSELVA